MYVIFDSFTPAVNSSFGLGLRSPQIDNTLPRHPADAASIDEVAAWSIARTIAEETASYYDHIVEMDRLEQMAADYDAVPAL